jgi:hypothetical protein
MKSEHPQIEGASQVAAEPESSQDISSGSLPWYRTWWLALTKPSLTTYERIARDPNATRNHAYRWLLVSSLIWGFFTVLVGVVRKSIDPTYTGIDFSTISGGTGLGVLLIALFAALSEVVGVAIETALTNFLARNMGSESDFPHLLYTVAAYTCPMIFIMTALSNLLFPLQALITIVLYLFRLFLNMLAVKAVYQFKWKSAIITSVAVQVAILGFTLIISQGRLFPATR